MPIEEYVASGLSVSATLPADDAGNATVVTRGSGSCLFEVTAVSGLTVTVEALLKQDGTWREVQSYQVASGTFTRRTAGTTITLSLADRIYVPGNWAKVRLKRQGGTSATFSVRAGAQVTDELVILLITSGLAATITGDALTALQLIDNLVGQEYETVAASQTAQVLGPTGATGDLLNGVLIIPATTSPGNVIILDNATSITIFTGGASSVSNLVPFFVPLGIRSVSGAWKITTGASVSAIGVGDFT